MATDGARAHSLGLLRIIAVFKFMKALLVIATGFALSKFYDPAVTAFLYRLEHVLPYRFEQKMLGDLLGFLSGMSPKRIQIIAAATFCYAALFLVEGTGLWLGYYWAELLTVIATGSLVPVEIYEIHHRFTWIKVLVLVVNLVILGYLVWRVCREAGERRALAGPPAKD